jgi:hypothetical protein
MALDIPTNRAFRTLDELTDLIKAIAEAPAGTQETNWVEWKTALDLETPAGKFTVGKAILGFSNRSPEVATQKCQGVAYMVIGVEPQNVVGTPLFDHAKLSQKIKTYADGPRWSAEDIEYNDKNVLVIIIEPPQNGDRIHTLQKTLNSAYAGAIYHRGTAQSEPAGPQEVAMLQERLLAGARQPELDLALAAQGAPLTRQEGNRDDVQAWLDRREKYIQENTHKPPSQPPPPPPRPATSDFGPTSIASFADIAGLRGGIGGMGGIFPSDMYAKPEDAEEFESRVQEHLSTCKSRLPQTLQRRIINSKSNKVAFTVINETKDPIEGVQLVVQIRGNLVAFAGSPRARRMPSLPKWPGPLDDIRPRPETWAIHEIEEADYLSVWDGSVEFIDDGIEITFGVGDLRPGQRHETPAVTLIVGPAADEALPVTLTARAMNRRGEKTVETTLAVSTQRWPIDHWISPEH